MNPAVAEDDPTQDVPARDVPVSDVDLDEVPTLELPVIGPGKPAVPSEAGPAEPEDAPAEPVRPLRTIVIGDRDGLTAAPAPPVAPVPPVVRKARLGRLVFGDDAAAERPTAGDAADEPALTIGPPSPDRARAGALPPPRTIVIGDADEVLPEIDPRIKDRRRRVLRAAGLRRLRWVIAALAVIALVVGFNVTLRSPLFQVREVAISGTNYVDPADLEPLRQRLLGEPLVSIDLGAIRREIEENVWVRTVDVSRDWPRAISIDIEERRPVAYYPGDDGLIHLVDVDGRVLATLEGMPVDFVMVEGAGNTAGPGEDAPEVLLPAIRVANDLPVTLRSDVRVVRIVQEGVVLDLHAGGIIVLGDLTDLRDKLVAALTVRQLCSPGSYQQLDVRVPSRPAVTPRTGCGGALTGANQ